MSKNIFITDAEGNSVSLEFYVGKERGQELKQLIKSKYFLYKKPRTRTTKKAKKKNHYTKLSRRQYLMEKFILLGEAKNRLDRAAAIMLSGELLSAHTISDYAKIPYKAVHYNIQRIVLSAFFKDDFEINVHGTRHTYQYKGDPITDLQSAMELIRETPAKNYNKIKKKGIKSISKVTQKDDEKEEKINLLKDTEECSEEELVQTTMEELKKWNSTLREENEKLHQALNEQSGKINPREFAKHLTLKDLLIIFNELNMKIDFHIS